MSERPAAEVEAGTPPVVSLHGDVDRGATDQVDAVANAIVEMETETVILDFSGSGYINSSGIALIVGLLGKARAAGISVHARGLSDHYRHVFEITRLSAYMTIDDEGGTS